MNFRRMISFAIALTMVAALVACSSSSSKSGTTIAITATGGTPQSATIGGGFTTALSATVTSNGTPASGVSVTFTVVAGGTGASGAFATTPTSDTETTNASGVATTSQTLTANGTAGTFTVTATTTGATTPATFTLTNNAASTLAAGNYVFSLAGTDSGTAGFTSSFYSAAGVIVVGAGGSITGEMSFSDFNYYVQEAITGGSVAVNPADSNLLITINTGDTNIGPGATTLGSGSGTLVFSAAMASSTRGLLTEYDSWATSLGELNAQTSTAALCPSAPGTPCGYAIYLGGLDATGFPIGVGEVLTIDGAGGGISGTGSVFDINDGGTLFPNLPVSSGTVSAPDSMGYVTITVNSAGFFGGSPGILLDGYIVDANHIRLVEDWYSDALNSLTGGTALAQTGTGGFTSASVSGSIYVVSMPGADTKGALQVAGMLTFNANGTVGGNLSFNDITGQSPQGGTAITGGTWADDGSGTGRVLVTGATDGSTFSYNLTLYETGDGNATILSMDINDLVVGLGRAQASGLGVPSLTGNYTLGLYQVRTGVEFDADGQITANAAALSLTGFTDQNKSLLGSGLKADSSVNATYSGTASSPIISINGGGGSTFTVYLVDGTQSVFIENDNAQLSLGYVTNQ
jgi:hypothetical protein